MYASAYIIPKNVFSNSKISLFGKVCLLIQKIVEVFLNANEAGFIIKIFT